MKLILISSIFIVINSLNLTQVIKRKKTSPPCDKIQKVKYKNCWIRSPIRIENQLFIYIQKNQWIYQFKLI